MKEDVMLSLMQKNPVVAWNPVIDGPSLTRKEFFTLARINGYETSETEEGWYLAYRKPHNFKSACDSLGMNYHEKMTG